MDQAYMDTTTQISNLATLLENMPHVNVLVPRPHELSSPRPLLNSVAYIQERVINELNFNFGVGLASHLRHETEVSLVPTWRGRGYSRLSCARAVTCTVGHPPAMLDDLAACRYYLRPRQVILILRNCQRVVRRVNVSSLNIYYGRSIRGRGASCIYIAPFTLHPPKHYSSA